MSCSEPGGRKGTGPVRPFDGEVVESYYGSLPKCPYCGKEEKDAWEIDFGSDDAKTVTCGYCDKEYSVRRIVDVSYESGPLKS